MTHSFDVELAEKHGIEYSLIVGYIEFMCGHNRRNKRNIHDDKAYTYNTYEALQEHFSYITKRKIETIIRDAEKNGHIESRNDLNDNKWDKTKWYHRTTLDSTFDDTKIAPSNNQKMDVHNKVHIKHNSNTVNKTKAKKFTFTLSKATQYQNLSEEYKQKLSYYAISKAGDRGADLLEAMIDHHSSNGKGFKDWAAAFRTWHRNDEKFNRAKKSFKKEPEAGSIAWRMQQAQNAADTEVIDVSV